MAVTVKRRGSGFVAVGPQAPGTGLVEQLGLATGPSRPAGMIFPRADTPFHGEGTRVTIQTEPGYTQHGKLTVPFRFQVPPIEDIARTSAFSWANFDVFDTERLAAERTRPGGRRLRTVPLSTMFVYRELPYEVWASHGTHDPVLATKQLEEFCNDGLKFRLRIRQHHFNHDDVDMLATMTQCVVTEKVSEPDTRYVAMNFQEYVPTQLERDAVHNTLGPWHHTIVKGDTLYSLARKYYRKQTDWRLIARAAANGNLENQAPSSDLLSWAKRHKRKAIVIPQNPRASVAVAA